MKKFYRSSKGEMCAGVCAGLADYFEIDVTLVRLVFVLGAIFMGGSSILVYIILAIIAPKV